MREDAAAPHNGPRNIMPVVHEAFFDVDAATGQLVRRPGITVSVSWHDLVWAAVTVGRRSQFEGVALVTR